MEDVAALQNISCSAGAPAISVKIPQSKAMLHRENRSSSERIDVLNCRTRLWRGQRKDLWKEQNSAG